MAEYDSTNEEERRYSFKEVSKQVGIPRSRIYYFTQLGLVTPTIKLHGRREIREFTDAEVSKLRSAKELLDKGWSPKRTTNFLNPNPEGQGLNLSGLLTEFEDMVLSRRFNQAPESLEEIGFDLGISRQSVYQAEKTAVAKLVKSYFTQRDLTRAANQNN